jgi:3-methyladenine DNA glycosylase AlkD
MPTSLASTLLRRLSSAFESSRDDERAGAMAGYMRDQFPFVGIPTPARVAIQREAMTGLPPPAERDLVAFALACWKRPEREYQYAACGYLRRHVGRCSNAFIDTAERLITTKSWWDTVDELAQSVVGSLVAAHPELRTTMDRWIDADDFWLARAAILHQNHHKARTDPDLLFEHCLRRAADRELFIRKAIGWALREYSKTDAEAVVRFVDDHHDELSGLSRTEALKWLHRRGRVPT